MTERSIIFSTPMVLARRAGLKTQTRRILQPQPPAGTASIEVGDVFPTAVDRRDAERRPARAFGARTPDRSWTLRSPYGAPGDRLWVREAWRTDIRHDACPPRDLPADAALWYEADGAAPEGFGRYRHSRFMMRRMSRDLLRIVALRVERLRAIGEADAIAEGMQRTRDGEHTSGARSRGVLPEAASTARQAYAQLWESLNGTGSWRANPWVWVVEFEDA